MPKCFTFINNFFLKKNFILALTLQKVNPETQKKTGAVKQTTDNELWNSVNRGGGGGGVGSFILSFRINGSGGERCRVAAVHDGGCRVAVVLGGGCLVEVVQEKLTCRDGEDRCRRRRPNDPFWLVSGSFCFFC